MTYLSGAGEPFRVKQLLQFNNSQINNEIQLEIKFQEGRSKQQLPPSAKSWHKPENKAANDMTTTFQISC